MVKEIAVLGGDRRQHYLAKALQKTGISVISYAVPGFADTRATLEETLADAGVVILPLPALDRKGDLFCTDETHISIEAIAAGLRRDALLFGGKLDAAAELLSRRAQVADYFQWEPLTLANAVPTAEGAIQLAMEHTDCTLFDSELLVIGAGRIGTCLALRLKALGAHVTVTARKDADLARLRTLGLGTDTTGKYARGLEQYDGLFNTVPAPVLTLRQLRALREDCPLIELASAPGGFSPEDCKTARRHYLSGAALPGKVAPRTAGELIAGEILSYIRRSPWNNL